MSYQDCCEYFGRKLDYWNTCREDCDINEYVSLKEEDGIRDELENDSIFHRVVCPFLSLYAKQEQSNMVLSILSEAYSVARGNLTQSVLNIIIGAALKGCGYQKRGNETIGLALLAMILGGAIWWFSGEKRKTTSKKRKTSKRK